MMIPNKSLSLTGLVLFGGITFFIYVLFVLYSHSSSEELVNAWLDSERMEIQNGNFLSSVAKTQRIILSSKLINGVRLEDLNNTTQKPLLAFGKGFSPASDSCPTQQFSSEQVGLFAYVFSRCLSVDRKIKISFFVDGVRTFWIFTSVVILSFIIFGGSLFAILKIRDRESSVRMKMLEEFNDVAKQVAHDLRSPLTAIGMTICQPVLREDDLKMISSAGDRLNAIASELLEKTESIYKETIAKDGFDVLMAVQEIVAEKLAYSKYSIIVSAAQAEISAPALDRQKFMRVISNLTQNSIESLQAKDQGSVNISINKYDQGIHVAIFDDGVGIDPITLEKLNSGAVLSTKKHGHGLGVSYARSFVEERGGALEISSSLGQGTMVSMTLPNCR